MLSSSKRGAAPVDSMSVREVVASWKVWGRGWYGQRTGNRVDWMRHVFQVLLPEFGDTPAIEFSPKRLKQLREILVSKGNSRGYVNQQIARLTAIFRWAVEEELVPIDVYQRLATVRPLQRGRTAAREPDPVGPVDEATIRRTLEVIHQPVADMIRVQHLLGCRPSELCSLRVDDIQPMGDLHVIVLKHHKTAWRGKSRVIPVGPQCWTILATYLEGRTPGAYVFTNNRRGFYDTASYRRAIRRACLDHRIPRWSPNQLRHARATFLRATCGLDVAQAILGHSSASTTERYAAPLGKAAADAAKQFG